MKKLYLGSIALYSSFLLLAIFFIIIENFKLSAALATFAILLLPAISHLRMRRQFASLRSLIRRTASNKNSSAITKLDTSLDDRLESIEKFVKHIDNSTSKISNKHNSSASTEDISKYANEMRRESRMLRLLIEQHFLQK